MKRRIAKRMVTTRYYRTPRGPGDEPDGEYTQLLPHQLIRLQRCYDKRDTSQAMEHDPNLGARARVARRKPRAGRKRS